VDELAGIRQVFGSVNLGNELRDARERLGLSREQISTATKIQLRKIAALEEGAFDLLPSGIYLDGIASAYAREVGLDVDAFVRRLRAHVEPPPPATLEEIAAARQTHQLAPELWLSPASGMLAFGGVALALAVAGVGVHFYPRNPGAGSEPQTVVAKTESLAPPVTQRIPDIFPGAVGTSGFEPVADPVEAPSVAAPTAVEEAGVPPRAVAEPIPAELPAPPQPVAEPKHLAAVSDVAGEWTFETRIESSSMRVFEGLRLGYRLELRQTDGRIEGTGRKISENGVSLSGGGRTPIAVHGTIDGGRLSLTFGEQGARRRSTGTFDLVVEDSGVLRGIFSSNAARSAGVVEARRL
jgi:cytoskeleton protein RodZ